MARADSQKGKKIAPKKTTILLNKNAIFLVSDFGADLPQDPEPLALGFFIPYMLGGQDPPPKGKKDCSPQKTTILLSKNAFFLVNDLRANFHQDLPMGPL